MNFLAGSVLAGGGQREQPLRPTESHETTTMPHRFPHFMRVLIAVGVEQDELDKLLHDPGTSFRVLYDRWVKLGGDERGKPRKSVRQIKEWLGRYKIKSIETKLAGKTRFQREDINRLLTIFFKYWSYESEREIFLHFDEGDLEGFVKKILTELFPSESSALKLPARRRISNKPYDLKEDETESSAALTKPSREIIEQLFIESDALVTISRERTFIGSSPADTMASFRMSIWRLYEFDRADDRRRALIWIVDAGGRENTESALNMFINMEALATQFRAISMIEDRNSRELWEWFRQRAIVLVGSLRRSEIDYCYSRREIQIPRAMLDLSTFAGDRLLLEAIPPRWLERGKIADAFGRREGELWRRPTITSHLSLGGWEDLEHDGEVDQRKDLKYLLHSSMAQHPSGALIDEPRCVEIGQPGWRWSGGFRLACTAAFGRLGWEDLSAGRITDWQEAMAQFRRHNFAVLKVDEFRRLSNMIAEMPLEKRGDPEVAP